MTFGFGSSSYIVSKLLSNSDIQGKFFLLNPPEFKSSLYLLILEYLVFNIFYIIIIEIFSEFQCYKNILDILIIYLRYLYYNRNNISVKSTNCLF